MKATFILKITIISVLLYGINSSQNLKGQTINNIFFNCTDDIVGLDYTSGTPVVNYTGISNGYEGIAHAEDGSGNILFYVNSNGVYNPTSGLIAGSAGIFADPSSTEINICPFVGQPNKYYIIYNNETCSDLYYTVVDMSLNGGQGGILQLNTVISNANFAEGLEIVRKTCQNSFWLIAYKCNVGFWKFSIDSAGISDDGLGIAYSEPGAYDGRGELDYHKGKIGIAFAFSQSGAVVDFDPVTGIFSNPVTIAPSVSSTPGGFYGCEFSPNADYVYFSRWYYAAGVNLIRYNFNTQVYDLYSITSPQAPGGSDYGPGQIELAVDNKLYMGFSGSNQIVVIDNPGAAVPNFSYITVTSTISLGCSDHIQSNLFESYNFTNSAACEGDSVVFDINQIQCAPGQVTFLWDFGDPASGLQNNSTLQSPSHLFTGSGSYQVTLYVAGAINDTIVNTVQVSPSAIVDLGTDTILCAGQTIVLDAGQTPNAVYSWNTGQSSQTISVNTSGIFIVDVALGACLTTDSINVFYELLPAVNLGPDQNLCDGEEITLNIPAIPFTASVLWSDGSNGTSLNVTSEGTYWLEIALTVCSRSDTVVVNYFEVPQLNLADSIFKCPGTVVVVESGLIIENYLWSDLSTASSLSTADTGNFSLTVNNNVCGDTAYFYIGDIDYLSGVFMPNVFTPNNDTKNDEFAPQLSFVDELEMMIFDRWGKEVYSEKSSSPSWDGANSGTDLPDGVYFYIAKYTETCTEEPKVLKGILKLFR